MSLIVNTPNASMTFTPESLLTLATQLQEDPGNDILLEYHNDNTFYSQFSSQQGTPTEYAVVYQPTGRDVRRNGVTPSSSGYNTYALFLLLIIVLLILRLNKII